MATMSPLVIAVDAMGGDHAPGVIVEGAAIARERYPQLRFVFFGDEAKVAPLIRAQDLLADCSELVHTATAISADEKPSAAMRRGKGTSMWLACEAVREGKAQAAVSAGNTGALMAIAMLLLRTAPAISRPAIASFVPTIRGESVMLDLGANVGCDERNLVEFAFMGAAFARASLGLPRPRVALLNIGTEDLKGNEAIRGAAQILRDTADLPFDFTGFVEGNGIAQGQADVIVSDGFAGNIALKTQEGTARLVSAYLAATFRRSIWSMLGYFLARPALQALRERLDPNRYNGGAFLGLNGLVVKSHGGTNAVGFAAAIAIAADLAIGGFAERILEDLKRVAPATGGEASSESGSEAQVVVES
ncbi:phosphate acyltransferase PlsX [Zavarzinia sp.]|uniref:phosphate acyltransferase PlsX n=1 Tax=Zavarzinia sp. TaxID=2027920 RepID=UPI0035620FA0